LDEGRLTDSHGRTVDFKNTIIILTSNVGSDILAGASDLLEEEQHENILEKEYYQRQNEKLNQEGENKLFSINEEEEEEEDLLGFGKNIKDGNNGQNSGGGRKKKQQTQLESNPTHGLSRTEKYIKEEVMNRVRSTFSPEFINRIDDIILFNRLDKSALLEVLDLEIDKVQKKLEENNDIEFHITKPAKEWLLMQGYDPAYGARPIRRTIQSQLLNPLARMLISGKITNDSIIELSQIARKDLSSDTDIILSEDTDSNNMFKEELETDQLIVLRKLGFNSH
jgi:ATP-dependent Clp protease ATP-binding subunit ClpA